MESDTQWKTMNPDNRYIPAFGFDWLTWLYDPFLNLVMQESRFKGRLIREARIEKGHRVFDLGCGTGTLTILIKRMHPESDVFGLDGDSKVLEMARKKARRAGVEVSLSRGMAFSLPYPDGSFDRVFSSLVLHHLTTENKLRTLGEIYRVIRPGGELLVVDFGRPQNTYSKIASLLVLRLEETAELIKGLLPEMLALSGFVQIEETTRFTTLFGTFSLSRARRPDSGQDLSVPRVLNVQDTLGPS